MHNIDSMDAFGWKTAFLPLNCFLWIFVRQFHFTSRHATPTFITLFKAHFPTTARKLLFFQYAGQKQLPRDKMTPSSAALLRQRLDPVV
jgi:hypothetical protein